MGHITVYIVTTSHLYTLGMYSKIIGVIYFPLYILIKNIIK